MNCHVLFKQVYTILCICTLEKNAYPANMKGFDPGTSRLLEIYFTTGLFYKLKYSNCNRRDRVRLGWSVQSLRVWNGGGGESGIL